MKHFIDGDQLCITTDHFVDLQESPAVFVPVDSDEGRLIQAEGVFALPSDRIEALFTELRDGLTDTDCPNWGRTKYGYGPCGACDACEINDWV